MFDQKLEKLNEKQTQKIKGTESDLQDYRYGVARLDSFRDWKGAQNPKYSAAAGFFHKGPGDLLECFACKVQIHDWEPTDNPWVEHQRWSWDCLFLRGTDCGNVPIRKLVDTCGASMEHSERLIKEGMLCKKCKKHKCEILSVPCQHVICCRKCAYSEEKCPKCKEFVTHRESIYFKNEIPKSSSSKQNHFRSFFSKMFFQES